LRSEIVVSMVPAAPCDPVTDPARSTAEHPVNAAAVLVVAPCATVVVVLVPGEVEVVSSCAGALVVGAAGFGPEPQADAPKASRATVMVPVLYRLTRPFCSFG
jgi:hypothetical protein